MFKETIQGKIVSRSAVRVGSINGTEVSKLGEIVKVPLRHGLGEEIVQSCSYNFTSNLKELFMACTEGLIVDNYPTHRYYYTGQIAELAITLGEGELLSTFPEVLLGFSSALSRNGETALIYWSEKIGSTFPVKYVIGSKIDGQLVFGSITTAGGIVDQNAFYGNKVVGALSGDGTVAALSWNNHQVILKRNLDRSFSSFSFISPLQSSIFSQMDLSCDGKYIFTSSSASLGGVEYAVMGAVGNVGKGEVSWMQKRYTEECRSCRFVGSSHQQVGDQIRGVLAINKETSLDLVAFSVSGVTQPKLAKPLVKLRDRNRFPKRLIVKIPDSAKKLLTTSVDLFVRSRKRTRTVRLLQSGDRGSFTIRRPGTYDITYRGKSDRFSHESLGQRVKL